MTDHFPVQYSTLSAQALASFVEKRYHGRGVSCRFLQHGVSDAYVIDVQDGAKYVLKVYRGNHRKINELRGEVELLDLLHQQGANVSYVIKDQFGDQIQEFNAPEGPRYGILFSYAQGRSIRELSDDQVQIVGREMAYNHNITSQLELSFKRKSYDIDTTLIAPIQSLESAFKTFPEGYEYLKSLSERLIRKMAGFDAQFWNFGYCHYDYLPKNFHFDEQNNFTLFDFDFAGKGPLVNDLASFQVHFFLQEIQSILSPTEAERQWQLFLKAYRKGCEISDEEIAAIPYLGLMFWTFYLGYQYEHYDDWSNFFFNDAHLHRMISWLKRWEEMYCQF